MTHKLSDLMVGNVEDVRGDVIPLRCPHCGQFGSFPPASNELGFQIGREHIWFAGRICPNHSCKRIIFIVYNASTSTVIDSYPPLRIDWEKGDIPQDIVRTFEEALDCHAHGCYVAAAIMVRRILEEICENRKCKGKDLHQRLEDLKLQLLLPQGLIDAAFELKILGNDATHVNAKAYQTIGKEEVEAAIDLAKEILKGLFQLDSLLSRLRGLKASSPP